MYLYLFIFIYLFISYLLFFIYGHCIFFYHYFYYYHYYYHYILLLLLLLLLTLYFYFFYLLILFYLLSQKKSFLKKNEIIIFYKEWSPLETTWLSCIVQLAMPLLMHHLVCIGIRPILFFLLLLGPLQSWKFQWQLNGIASEVVEVMERHGKKRENWEGGKWGFSKGFYMGKEWTFREKKKKSSGDSEEKKFSYNGVFGFFL